MGCNFFYALYPTPSCSRPKGKTLLSPVKAGFVAVASSLASVPIFYYFLNKSINIPEIFIIKFERLIDNAADQ